VTPEPYELVLLALAAFRVTRLIGWDDITEPWRHRLAGYDDAPGAPRGLAARLVECPWCLGWWVSLGWWAAWARFEDETLLVATPWAVAALVGLAARWLDP
jgi:hypothetical protein